MGREGLGVYAALSRLRFPRSYGGMIVLVAFAGTHAPLLALVAYLLLFVGPAGRLWAHSGVLALVLGATLLGFVATLLGLRALFAPVRVASSSLGAYLNDGTKPELPIRFSDRAGRLMADVQYAVDHFDSTIRSLEDLSGTDHLTGVLNRRQGEKRLAEEAARTRQRGELLTVGVVDVNRFKQVNDNFGHQAGDACIRHVAAVIRRNIRAEDWLARWGGDEFLLVLRDSSVFAPTEAVLQRIVGDLKRSPARLPGGQEMVVSISVGAVRYPDGEDLGEVLEQADGAMYEAKREGRPWVLVN